MIDFSIDEDLEMVSTTAQRFSTEVLALRHREFETACAVPDDVSSQAAEIGFDRIDWPESCGGASLGAQARAAVLQHLAQGCPGATLGMLPMGQVAHALLAFGGQGALQQQAGALASIPGARAVLVVDPNSELQKNGNRITGTVPWVPASRVDLLAVLTPTELHLVRNCVETQTIPGSGLRAAGASTLVLSDAPIEHTWINAVAARQALSRARLDIAAMLVGQMHAAAEFSRQYALERVAFGRPIAHHQALAFLIVDMYAAVEAARHLVCEAASRVDAGEGFEQAAATAYLEAVETSSYIGSNAVQILGGPGFMRDYPVEKHMREMRALSALAGGADLARDDLWATESPEQSGRHLSFLTTEHAGA